jgi:glycine/D-amino acid oxidase-like deaminating enzyme
MPASSHPWGTPPWTINFRPAKKPLPAHADFVVVGGGFAGLSAGAWLAKLGRGKSVVVLESESVGNGASGRTGGMVLDQTAAGALPGLGNVLAGYKKILRALHVDAHLSLPGAWELARKNARKDSPISWNDSGDLRVVRKECGGSINPGRVVSGLARAAQKAGAQIIEHAEAFKIDPAPKVSARPGVRRKSSLPLTVHVRLNSGGRVRQVTITADEVLLTTNAGSLGLSELAQIAEPKLTLAVATEPLTPKQLREIGLASRHPFYTVDFPYLWGRLLENNGVIFGAGLLPRPSTANSPFEDHRARRHPRLTFGDLLRFDVRKGETRECFDWLESRVHNLHPALKDVRITHRWGGPILFTENFRPVFRRHPKNERVLVLGAFAGHGVALSVYLGHRAAEVLLGLQTMPRWARSRR